MSQAAVKPSPSASAHQLVAKEIDNAVAFLRSVLADGPMQAVSVEKEARRAGFSRAILESAKRLAGIRTHRSGFGRRAVCKCFLPSQLP